VIDLKADAPAGEYPLLDIYSKHGKVVFQLHAACIGCDYTLSLLASKDLAIRSSYIWLERSKGVYDRVSCRCDMDV